MPRVMNPNAYSKHRGHACEGHLRGLVHHLPNVRPEHVLRKLPFSTTVKPDVVVVDDSGGVRWLLIVAYWEDSKSSEKKAARCRTEYREARLAGQDRFADDARIVTVLYGHPDGWKAKILSDLRTQCRPLLFLPDLLDRAGAQAIVDDNFEIYRDRFENSRASEPAAADTVTNVVKARAPTAGEKRILAFLSSCSKGRELDPLVSTAVPDVRLPSSPLSTRYRQPLAMLSLFTPDEVRAGHAGMEALPGSAAEGFARRASFLDLAGLSCVTRLGGRNSVSVSIRDAGIGRNDYEPHRPDFAFWRDTMLSDIEWILRAHRGRVRSPGDVFRAGARDQAIGNYPEIAGVLVGDGASFVDACRKRRLAKGARILTYSRSVGPEAASPAQGQGQIFPLWGFAVTALGLGADQNRADRADWSARRKNPPTMDEAKELTRQLSLRANATCLIHLEQLVAYARALRAPGLVELAQATRPRLLMLEEAKSWLADAYNTLMTNSSHNPLNEVLRCWMSRRFPALAWSGWPGRRSTPLSSVIPGATSRRQWTMLAQDGDTVFAAEAKSVTANHTPDKLKEVQDRVDDLRSVCRTHGLRSRTFLLFDGDLSQEALNELRSGCGPDEVWGVAEILERLRSRADWTVEGGLQ